MFTAVIPARGHDDRIENKNILSFGDSNLLTHKIRQLKKCRNIQNIIVSTESDEIAEISKNAGASVIARPLELSLIDADFGLLCSHVADNVLTEHVIWAPVTCPLVTSKTFENAIDVYSESITKGYDSLISVNKIKRYLLDANGPLNFRFSKSSRQAAKLPVLHEYVNAISICSKTDMKKWKYNWGKIPYKFELPVHMQIDICDIFEYEVAKLVYGANHEIYD